MIGGCPALMRSLYARAAGVNPVIHLTDFFVLFGKIQTLKLPHRIDPSLRLQSSTACAHDGIVADFFGGRQDQTA
jgi:hypothetical protein